LTLEEVAGFAITQVAFNPAGKYLAWSSVANTVSVVKLDKIGQSGRLWVLVQEYKIWIMAIVALMLAILYMFYRF
jgi:hypothetical protein